MKKYIVSLMILFVMQSCCAMELNLFDKPTIELDPFDMSIDYDNKCYWTARYLHKYPRGKNEQEAKAIERFFEDGVSEQVTICPWLVTKYKNMFGTHEAHRYLNSMYTYQEIHRNNPKWNGSSDKEELCYEIRYFSADLRKKIFTQALWFVAEDYYVAQNSLKFLEIRQPNTYHSYDPRIIESLHEPYFLAEINQKNVCIHFSISAWGQPLEEALFQATLFLDDKKVKDGMVIYKCKKEEIKDLIAFLDKKEERVHDFTEMFNNYIEQLSCVEKKEGPDAFIFLLTRLKELTQRVIYCYTGRARLT